jgi:hypothetical protein
MVTCDHYEDRRATVLAPTPPHNKHTSTHTHGQTVRTDQQDARGGEGVGGEGKMSKESGEEEPGFQGHLFRRISARACTVLATDNLLLHFEE